MSIVFITDANLDFIKIVQNVQFHHRQILHAVNQNGLTHQNGVEPAATARASRHRSEFATDFANAIAVRVKQFGRERTGADARRIGFDDTDDLIDVFHAHSRADSRLTGDRIRRCHKRIGAEIVVQHGRLSAFEQQVFPLFDFFGQDFPRGNGERQNKSGDFVQLFHQFGFVDQRLPPAFAQGVVEQQ